MSARSKVPSAAVKPVRRGRLIHLQLPRDEAEVLLALKQDRRLTITTVIRAGLRLLFREMETDPALMAMVLGVPEHDIRVWVERRKQAFGALEPMRDVNK